MNCIFSNEESSSGSESGWTLYLDHSSSFNQENDYIHKYIGNSSSHKQSKEESEEETEYEEDLSMVSDASSGPAPHFSEEDSSDTVNYNFNQYCLYQHQDINCVSFSGSNGEKSKETRRLKKNNDRHSMLDDTASSHLLDYSTKTFSVTRNKTSRAELIEEYSQGYSSTQFQVRHDDYNRCNNYFPTSVSGNQLQQDQWSQRKRC